MPMGFLPTQDETPTSEADGIAKDGSIVVGIASETKTVNGVPTDVFVGTTWKSGVLAPLDIAQALFVSDAGHVIIGIDGQSHWLYLANGATSQFGDDVTTVDGIAPDGSFVVGVHGQGSDAVAFKMPADLTAADLPDVQGEPGSEAFASSAGGAVIVGAANGVGEPQPVYWDAKGVHKIPVPTGFVGGLATAVSTDGKIVAGFFGNSGTTEGFLYHPGDAKPYATFASPPGVDFVSVNGVSDDGSIACGDTSDASASPFGFVWESVKPQAAQDAGVFFKANGAAPTKVINSVAGCTANGATFAGKMSEDGGSNTEGYIAALTLKSHLIALAVNPAKVIGGNPSTGTATLDRKSASATTITLASSNSSIASVPASLQLPAGQLSADFTIATKRVALDNEISITGQDSDGNTQAATVTVQPSPLSDITITPGRVVGGQSSQGEVVFLNSVDTLEVVDLKSGNGAAAVPSEVEMPGGQTLAKFTVDTSPVPEDIGVSITATCEGESVTKTITVSAATILSLKLSPSSIAGGATSIGTVTLTGAAPSSGAAVKLTAGNSVVAVVPGSITVKPGDTSATFAVITKPVAALAGVPVTATYLGVQSQRLSVLPPALKAVAVKVASLVGGNGTTATVKLASKAPVVGMTVSLAGSSSACILPASAKVLNGQTVASFALSSKGVVSATTVAVTAKLGVVSKIVHLTIEPAVLSAVTVKPSTITGGAGAVGAVILNGKTGAARAIALQSGSVFTKVPASAAVSAQARSATFSLTTLPVSAATRVTITAKSGVVSKTATLTLELPPIASLTLATASVVGGVSVTGTVKLSAPAGPLGDVVALHSNSSAAVVPAGVTVPKGATSATFVVKTAAVSSTAKVTIQAVLGSSLKGQVLTINP